MPASIPSLPQKQEQQLQEALRTTETALAEINRQQEALHHEWGTLPPSERPAWAEYGDMALIEMAAERLQVRQKLLQQALDDLWAMSVA